jgi:hypothetical protein
MHFSLLQCAPILSVGQTEHSLSLERVTREIPFIGGAIWKSIIALAVFLPVEKISLIVCSIFPLLLALPVGQIVEPLSRVSIVISFIYQCPLSLCDIVSHLALIVTSLAENVATIAVGKAMSKRAEVV